MNFSFQKILLVNTDEVETHQEQTDRRFLYEIDKRRWFLLDEEISIDSQCLVVRSNIDHPFSNILPKWVSRKPNCTFDRVDFLRVSI